MTTTQNPQQVGRRLVGGFLIGLTLLLMLFGRPDRDDGGPAALAPLELCEAMSSMVTARDALVSAGGGQEANDLKDAAQHARDVGHRVKELTGLPRDGLDYLTGLVLALPDRPTTRDLLYDGTLGTTTVSRRAALDDLNKWLRKHCGRSG